ncbi:MAG: hypothetical protein OXC30_03230 [Alphaproteobacteria bacterium]|nr:hypothetical protein [Alphaproteobacteria bacterium]
MNIMFYIPRLLLCAFVLHGAEDKRVDEWCAEQSLREREEVRFEPYNEEMAWEGWKTVSYAQMLNQDDLWILDALDLAEKNADAIVWEKCEKVSDALMLNQTELWVLETGNMSDDSICTTQTDGDLALCEEWMQVSGVLVLDRLKHLVDSWSLEQGEKDGSVLTLDIEQALKSWALEQSAQNGDVVLALDRLKQAVESWELRQGARLPTLCELFSQLGGCSDHSRKSECDNVLVPKSNIESVSTTSHSQPKRILNADKQEEKAQLREDREIEKIMCELQDVGSQAMYHADKKRQKRDKLVGKAAQTQNVLYRDRLTQEIKMLDADLIALRERANAAQMQTQLLRDTIREEWRKQVRLVFN